MKDYIGVTVNEGDYVGFYLSWHLKSGKVTHIDKTSGIATIAYETVSGYTNYTYLLDHEIVLLSTDHVAELAMQELNNAS